MNYKVENAKMLSGRLLVEAIRSSNVDENLGIELTGDPHDTVLANVVVTSDETTFPVGCTVFYDRIHGKGVKLLDADGVAKDYRVVQTADVSLIIR